MTEPNAKHDEPTPTGTDATPAAESLEADGAGPAESSRVRVWNSGLLMNELQLGDIDPSLKLKSDIELVDQLLPPGPVESENEPDHVEHCSTK